MQENLLQFIWQHSLYQPTSLATTNKERVTVVHPGIRNRDAGPDFLEARVRIGDTLLVGNIELHINSGDWLKHGHQDDEAYKNIILHVVYKDDVANAAGSVPVLELQQYIAPSVIENYQWLVNSKQVLPCASHLSSIKDITKEAWLSRLLAERWEMKLAEWEELMQETAGDWRNLLYWRMAANFGFKINTVPFLAVARSIPLNVLARHRENLVQIEALLFGQAGMLKEEFEDEYPKLLKKEYEYLANKYQLKPIASHLWKFLRMRPANFPTIRIAQFAALVHRSVHLFSKLVEVATIKEVTNLLQVQASSYWDNHVKFDEELPTASAKHLGKSSIHNVIINTVAPIQFLYGRKQGEYHDSERALQLLDTVPAEKNHILDTWQDHSWKATNASQSQALLQLYNTYCSSKRCLECAIGHNIIKAR